jgi:hypothetical protein
MGVQVFEDRNDRQFWVIGSTLDVNPAAVALDIQNQCSPSSIKFVMITSVESLWARMLAPYFFYRYLRPELTLVRLDEIDTLISVSKSYLPPTQDVAAAAKALGTIADRQRADLLAEIQVVTSISDNPMLAKYVNQKLLELQHKMAEYDMLQEATRQAMHSAMTSLRTLDAAP